MQKITDYTESRLLHYPEAVSIVIVKEGVGKFNPMSAAWSMFTSIEPRMMAISIGFERYTYELMLKQKEFVISYPSIRMAEEVRFFGSESGRDIDKLKVLGTSTQPAKVIDGILLAEASLNFECVMKNSMVTGDHVIFSGEVVACHAHTESVPRIYTLGPKNFGGFQ
jgi:flavin reductase (DIM6/NTAB) family NADH-FMN oxidoreductase RutF